MPGGAPKTSAVLRTVFPEESPPRAHTTLRTTYASEEHDRESVIAIQGIILKPHGELGRPGRGGYSLRMALAWDIKTYKKVQVRHPQLGLLGVLMLHRNLCVMLWTHTL